MSLRKDSVYTLNNGRTIPVSGFGVYKVPASETKKLTYDALKVGYRHIDTARAYGNEKESAEGIAEFLKDFPQFTRSDIYYTTKVLHTEHGYECTKAAVEDSIRHAESIGYIDLVLLHSPLAGSAKRLEAWEALQEFTADPKSDVDLNSDSVKIKAIGVSNYGVHHLEELFKWEGLRVPPVLNQVELHPWLPRKDIQQFAKAHGMLLGAYSALTRGKKFDDVELVKIAKKHNCSPAEVLLRWSYAQGFIPLAKTATVSRIAKNFNVLDNVVLDNEDYAALDKESYEVLTWDPTVYEN